MLNVARRATYSYSYSSCRRHNSTAAAKSLIALLLENKELDTEDARNELRWMRQALPRTSATEEAVRDMVQRRSRGEPLQYILDFGPLTLLARPPVLIPRPETAFIFEKLAERILAARDRIARPLTVLDLCTGSGCIPLLLSSLLGNTLGAAYGVDINPHAIALSRDNIASVGDRNVQVLQADILSPTFVSDLRERIGGVPIDIITSNPPYIPLEEWEALPASVKEYEDRLALVGGPVSGIGDGVAFYAHIAKLAEEILRPEPGLDGHVPRVAVEIGAKQGSMVAQLLPGMTEVVQDQYGLDRMVLSTL